MVYYRSSDASVQWGVKTLLWVLSFVSSGLEHYMMSEEMEKDQAILQTSPGEWKLMHFDEQAI